MQNENRTIVCPNCRNECRFNMVYCPNCGYQFQQQWPPNIERPSLSTQKDAKINVFEAITAVIIGFLCIIPGILLGMLGPAAILIICLVKSVSKNFKKFLLIGVGIAGFIIVAVIGSCFGGAIISNFKH